ncbi:MAG: J domain-containing protein, partial [Thermoplasmatales archaeon]|nr:J domain-containing protein [Thermoplasmatales archaeon]
DLHMIKEITFPEAAIGTKTEVTALDGSIERIKIPEGTQNGEIFKIRGKGMSSLRGRGQGDLYVEIQINTPKKLSRKARKLLEDLKDEI